MSERRERELSKQRAEIQAWIDIARDKGESFMAGGRPEGDLTPYQDVILVDVGCGPRPFVEHFPARFAYMVDCCMLGYAREGLLQASTLSSVCLIDGSAEALPFAAGSVDIVFAINMLDHTLHPQRCVAEFRRILRPGGAVHLHVDIGGEPNECEPVVFSREDVAALFAGFRPLHLAFEPPSNPGRVERLIAVVAKAEDEVGSPRAPERATSFEEVLVSPLTGNSLRREPDALVDVVDGRRFPLTDGVWDLRPEA